MSVGVLDGLYKDVPAKLLRSEALEVMVLPSVGGRIASLRWLADDRELLWQNSHSEHATVRYGMSYDEGEFAGIDDMLPTINPDVLDSHPWEGVSLPDHGEVWSLPWQESSGHSSISLNVDGLRLPYTLSKVVQLDSFELRVGYTLENRSRFEMPMLYAAHPLFNVDEGDSLVVPNDLRAVWNAVPSAEFAELGKELTYPLARDDAGQQVDLSTMPARGEAGYRKFYFRQPVSEGRAEIIRHDAKLRIAMQWEPTVLPYLGVWMNYGGFADQYNLAPEPATAGMDSPTSAQKWGMESVLEPSEVVRWEWAIKVSSIAN